MRCDATEDRPQQASGVNLMLDTQKKAESGPEPFSTEFVSQWVEALQASVDHHKRSSRWHRRQMRSAAERLSKLLKDCERLNIDITPQP